MNKLLDAPTISYCEKAGEGLIKRPYYALTNLAYLFVALFIYFRNPKSKLAQQFAVLSFLIGSLSFIYDATYVRLTQLIDLGGMLIFILFLIYLNLKVILKVPVQRIILPLTLSLLVMEFIIFSQGGYSGNIIFGLLILSYMATERFMKKQGLHTNYKPWFIALTLFVIGFLIWITDTKGWICFEFGLLNGRAIFHYLTALSIYYLYSFYASQEGDSRLE